MNQTSRTLDREELQFLDGQLNQPAATGAGNSDGLHGWAPWRVANKNGATRQSRSFRARPRAFKEQQLAAAPFGAWQVLLLSKHRELCARVWPVRKKAETHAHAWF